MYLDMYIYVCISYNIGKSALFDIYMRTIPEGAAPKGEYVFIRQSMSACVITNIYQLRHY